MGAEDATHHDQDVAHAEHVGQRQRPRQRPHVAQEPKGRVGQQSGVHKAARTARATGLQGQSGAAQGGPACGHHPAVGQERGQVGARAQADEAHPGHLEVGQHVPTAEQIRRHIGPRSQAVGKGRLERDKLHEKGGGQHAAATQPKARQKAESAPGEGHGGQAQREQGDQ
jgi:hypothetical protein